MSLAEIFLLAVALAMDCLTVSIVSGVFVRSLEWKVDSGQLKVDSGQLKVDSGQLKVDSYDYQSSADMKGVQGNHNCQLSTLNSQLSTLNSQLSTLNSKLSPLRSSFLFGFFQALMPLIGWIGISRFSSYLEAVDHWIAFGLLVFIGGRMVLEAFDEEEHQHFDPRRLRTQLILAVATSIDALAVGISMACTGYDRLSQLTLPLLIIGVVSFLFSLFGWWLGACFGKRVVRLLKPELLGGIILVGIGFRILLTHLFENATN